MSLYTFMSYMLYTFMSYIHLCHSLFQGGFWVVLMRSLVERPEILFDTAKAAIFLFFYIYHPN